MLQLLVKHLKKLVFNPTNYANKIRVYDYTLYLSVHNFFLKKYFLFENKYKHTVINSRGLIHNQHIYFSYLSSMGS